MRELDDDQFNALTGDWHKTLVGMLIDLRRGRGFSQAQLAERMEVNQSQIAKIEVLDRRVEVEMAIRICLACEASPEDFFRDLLGRIAADTPPPDYWWVTLDGVRRKRVR